jgi:predicted AlkP superfamily pyrophosphatase or phosphodiesterase
LPDKLLLVVLIDALGYGLVREHGAFEFLQAGADPVESVCGYSSACLPSLLTGRPPVEHGHWAMYLRDPEQSVFRRFRPFIRIFSQRLGRHGFTRRVIQRSVQRRVTGYFNLYHVPPVLLPQFDLCEKEYLFAPGSLPPLETPFDVAARLGVPWQSFAWQMDEEARRGALLRALRQGSSPFLFYYTPLLDAVMHARGTRGESARACLRDLEVFVREALAVAGRSYREVRLLVFGDHGMADVHGAHQILNVLRECDLRVPAECLAFVDSTMARLWYFRPGLRERVEERLSALPYGWVVPDEECARLGVLFPDRRYGETIFLAHSGEVLVPSFMGVSVPAAMHGYHPEHEDSDTILLTNFETPAMRSILEIGPWLSREIAALAGGAGA